MCRRLPRMLLAALTLNAALLMAAFSAPSVSFACSCRAPEPGAPRLSGNEEVVLMGFVGDANDLESYAFTVERVFKGEVAPVAKLGTGAEVLADGTVAMSSCGRGHTPGQHVVLASGIGDRGVISAAACSPYETVESPEGQALLREAVALFGPGHVPGNSLPADEAPRMDFATIAILGVLGLLALVVGVIVASIARGGGAAQSRA